jgi:hypothetical protein
LIKKLRPVVTTGGGTGTLLLPSKAGVLLLPQAESSALAASTCAQRCFCIENPLVL